MGSPGGTRLEMNQRGQRQSQRGKGGMVDILEMLKTELSGRRKKEGRKATEEIEGCSEGELV